MFRAAVIGWLIGKAIVGLLRGFARLVEGLAYLAGALVGLAPAARAARTARYPKRSPLR